MRFLSKWKRIASFARSGCHPTRHVVARSRPLAALRSTGKSFATDVALTPLFGLSLDFKLGFRMLVKYPGLTIVGGLAMAFGIWVGTITFVMGSMFINPTLPLRGGDRIVLLRNWDVAARSEEPRALGDFVVGAAR
jgi:hypothetical protein